MPGAIECRGLTKRFGQLTAVHELDLSLDAGTVLGFVCPNGAGKSTTIRMMLGLCVPTAGSVRLWGADPLRESKVRARVGYCPGELRLDERLTVAATLTSWGKLRHSTDTGFRDELVERLGVEPGRQVRGLSTGNRRKVALVGALMSRPDLLVLDEPTNGLDPLVQEEFMAILGEAASAGTSVLLSSHVLSEVERVANEVAVIREGAIVASGPTSQLRGNLPQVFRAVFAGQAPPAVEFSALPGALQVDAPSPRELKISWSGAPRPLLAKLGGYDIESLTAPEPDLETAFLSYYRNDEPAAARRAES